MAAKDCDGCGNKTEIKYLGKIRGELLCKKCRTKKRLEHREETINQSSEDEREKIRELSREQRNSYQRAYYKKNKKENMDISPPVIKGSTPEKRKIKIKSKSYFTFEDKKQLLRILMKKGLSFEESKERLEDHITRQKITTREMKAENKSKEEIKIKQQEMLEELWNY